LRTVRIELSVADCERVESALRETARKMLGDNDQRNDYRRAVAGYYLGLASQIHAQSLGNPPGPVVPHSIKRPDGSMWVPSANPVNENGDIVNASERDDG
jgi:hypothetical protein